MVPRGIGPRASASNLEPLGRPRSRFSEQYNSSKQDNRPLLQPDQPEQGRFPAQPEDSRHPDRHRSPPPSSPPPPSYPFEDRIRVDDSRVEPHLHEDNHSSRSIGCGPSASAANLIKLGPPRNRASQSYTKSGLGDNPHNHYDERNGNDKGRELYNGPAERELKRGLVRYEVPAERGEERRQCVYDRSTHHRRERSPERHDTRQVHNHDNDKQRDSHRDRTSLFDRGYRGRVAPREEGTRYDDSVIHGTIPRKRRGSFSPDEGDRPAKRSWDSEHGSDRHYLNNEFGLRFTPGLFKDRHVGPQNSVYHERSPSRRHNYYERRREASPDRRPDYIRDQDAHRSHGHERSSGLDLRRNEGPHKPFDHYREVSSAGKRHSDLPRLFEGRSDRYTPRTHGGTLRRPDLRFTSRSFSRREEEPRSDGRTMDERFERNTHRNWHNKRGGREYSPRANHQPLIVCGRPSLRYEDTLDNPPYSDCNPIRHRVSPMLR